MKIARIARVSVLAGALLCLVTGVSARQNVLGLDDMSCAAWKKSQADVDQRTVYIAWLRGFLSGHNYALPKQQVSTISSGTIELNINRFCTSTPNGSVSEAVMRLSDEFSGRNQPIRK
jgi:hypothetical protein